MQLVVLLQALGDRRRPLPLPLAGAGAVRGGGAAAAAIGGSRCRPRGFRCEERVALFDGVGSNARRPRPPRGKCGSRPAVLVAPAEEVGEVDAAALDDPDELFQLVEQFDDAAQLFAAKPARCSAPVSASRMISSVPARPRSVSVLRIARSFSTYSTFFLRGHLIERRLGDVDAAGLDQLVHVAEEERQQQRADVAAVHVGVGHDDDLAVAAFFHVEIVADAAAQGADDRANFLVAEHLHEVGLLDVEDLTLEGEDRLNVGIAALLGRATGGIPFDQEDLGVFVALGAAVGELAGQAAAFEACSCGG